MPASGSIPNARAKGVASTVRDMLTGDGAVLHVHATTHQGVDSGSKLPYPRPPHARITELVRRYLGADRRVGKGLLTAGTPDREDSAPWEAAAAGPADRARRNA